MNYFIPQKTLKNIFYLARDEIKKKKSNSVYIQYA